VLPGGMGRLYHSFFPKGGIAAQESGRAGGVGSGRLADLSPALKMVQAQPLFGTGDPLPAPPDLVQQAATTDDSTPAPSIIFDDQYLTSIVGHGLVGLAAVLWLVGALVTTLVRAARRAKGTLPVLSACTASVAGFVAAMLTFDAFAFVQCTIFFFTSAARGLRLARMHDLDKAAPAS
jgi:O-antigen ligase